MRVLFRFLLLIVAIWALFRLLLRWRRPLATGQAPPGASRRPGEHILSGGRMVLDEVCGTYVPEKSALSLRDGKNIRYFCSSACRDTHLAASREAEASR
jgi:hypothetical protein